MFTEVGRGLSIVCAGPWSGLPLTLTTILHPMFATLDGGGFAADRGRTRHPPARRRRATSW